MQAKTVKK